GRRRRRQQPRPLAGAPVAPRRAGDGPDPDAARPPRRRPADGHPGRRPPPAGRPPRRAGRPPRPAPRGDPRAGRPVRVPARRPGPAGAGAAAPAARPRPRHGPRVLRGGGRARRAGGGLGRGGRRRAPAGPRAGWCVTTPEGAAPAPWGDRWAGDRPARWWRPAPAGGAASRRSALRLLLAGQAASSLGDWMATVALMTLVLHVTDSATAVGGVLVLRLAPTVFAGPVAARLVTRWSRRRMMLAMDLVRIPAVAVTPWITELWWIYTWAFVTELAGMVFLPARDASIPDLVEGDDDLATANALVLGSSYGMIPVGAGVYALVATVTGAEGVLAAARIAFLVDAGTFVAAYLAARRLAVLGTATRADAAARVGFRFVAATFAASYLAGSRLPELGTATRAEAAGGGRFLDALRLPLVRSLAPAAAVVAFGLGALFSLGVVWVQEVLDASNV